MAKEDIEAAVRAALDARDPYTATKLPGPVVRPLKWAGIISGLAMIISGLAILSGMHLHNKITTQRYSWRNTASQPQSHGGHQVDLC